MDDGLVILTMVGVLATPVAYVVLQRRALNWDGALRFAAMVPILGWVVWASLLVRDLSLDPTSHNLFPFEILIGMAAGTAFLALLAAIRFFAGRRAA